ncbi:hypothetical protein BASA81_011609 [Batrachochytrium salamandrivorans]|nr:hypothetical protein BASA81_011609 [Batrachochytrium salamandrivorans]
MKLQTPLILLMQTIAPIANALSGLTLHIVYCNPLFHHSRQHPCLETKLLPRTLPRGKMGTVVCSSSFRILALESLVNLSSALSFREYHRETAHII